MKSAVTARLLASLALWGTVAANPPNGSDPEDELKAAIVLSFVRFADWPHTAPGTPITIAVFGRPAFVQVLRRTVEGKLVQDRPVRVVETKSMADAPATELIYFAVNRTPELKAYLLDPHFTHALTVGETKDFLELGGAVSLVEVDGHMSFEVSLDVLERTGITISSKLLRFGQIRGRRRRDL